MKIGIIKSPVFFEKNLYLTFNKIYSDTATTCKIYKKTLIKQ